MHTEPSLKTDSASSAVPNYNRWTADELAAFEMLEAELFAKYLDRTVSVRQFSKTLSKLMGKMLAFTGR